MDNIELLKRIAELNKCPECLGSGKYIPVCACGARMVETENRVFPLVEYICKNAGQIGADPSEHVHRLVNEGVENIDNKGIPHRHRRQPDCPTCHGTGAKLPELNETVKIFNLMRESEQFRKDNPVCYKYPENAIPAPTLEEVLELFKGLHQQEKCTDFSFDLLAGGTWYATAWFKGERTGEADKLPLTAALKLLEWWLQKEAGNE